MDQIKIGKFISQRRKARHLTQEQLGAMLHVSGKSVSKWENGNCLPEPSLYETLCRVLDISVEELFAGERMDNRSRIAEQNLMRMLKYRLYLLSDRSISFQVFDHALSRVSELAATLLAFESREAAVAFLVKATGCPVEDCGKAYDFYVGLFRIDEQAVGI